MPSSSTSITSASDIDDVLYQMVHSTINRAEHNNEIDAAPFNFFLAGAADLLSLNCAYNHNNQPDSTQNGNRGCTIQLLF
jgi:hypothetical protein